MESVHTHYKNDWFLNDKLRHTIDNRLKITSKKKETHTYTQWHCIMRGYTNDSKKKKKKKKEKAQQKPQKKKKTKVMDRKTYKQTDSQTNRQTF